MENVLLALMDSIYKIVLVINAILLVLIATAQDLAFRMDIIQNVLSAAVLMDFIIVFAITLVHLEQHS
jgi:hypothetical protein